MPLIILLLLALMPVSALAAVTNPFVTIDGQVAPLTPMPCPSGYTACYTIPMGTYGVFTVGAIGGFSAPTLLFADGPIIDALLFKGLSLTGPAGTKAVITYGGTYSDGAPGNKVYRILAAGQFTQPTTGAPIKLEGSGCFTAEGCLPMPFLTVTPYLIGGTNFSQGATGPQYCNVNGACGNTLYHTLTVTFQEDNTLYW